jgi:hypothetical protein
MMSSLFEHPLYRNIAGIGLFGGLAALFWSYVFQKQIQYMVFGCGLLSMGVGLAILLPPFYFTRKTIVARGVTIRGDSRVDKTIIIIVNIISSIGCFIASYAFLGTSFEDRRKAEVEAQRWEEIRCISDAVAHTKKGEAPVISQCVNKKSSFTN